MSMANQLQARPRADPGLRLSGTREASAGLSDTRGFWDVRH